MINKLHFKTTFSRNVFLPGLAIAMLFAAGMGIGLMYYGVAEPISHYVEPALPKTTVNAAKDAQLATFFHWGLHAWGIFSVMGLILAYFSFRYKLPLAVRSGLYPILRERINGTVGDIVDMENGVQYIPVTYYSDGRSGNDIQYLSRDEIIADVLREYERYLSIISDEDKAMVFVDKEHITDTGNATVV